MARNPAVKVTLPEETRDAVQALAKASGRSQSGVIADLLVQVGPKLVELAEAIEGAKKSPRALGAAMASGIGKAASVMRSDAA